MPAPWEQDELVQPAAPWETDEVVGEASAIDLPAVGAGETLLRRSTSALPLGKPVVDTISAGIVQALRPGPGAELTPQARAELEAMGETPAAEPGYWDTYRDIRDTGAIREAAGSDQHPLAAGAGTITGVGLSLLAPLPKVKVGTGTAGRIGSAALTGGAYQALNSGVASQADLTRGEWGQFSKDVVGVTGLEEARKELAQGHIGRATLKAMGAGLIGGLATGGTLGTVTELARKPLGDAMNKVAAAQGRRVLLNGADQLSTRKPVPDDVVLAAIDEGGIIPLGTTRGAAARLEGKADKIGAQYGQLLAKLEERGVRGPVAQEVADELLRRGAALERNTMIDQLPAEYLEQAEKIVGKAAPSPTLGLTQAEQLKRSLQKLAKSSYERLEPPEIADVRRDIASVVRQANEDAVMSAAGSNSQTAGLAEQFVPMKERLGKVISAEEAAQRGAARVAQRKSGAMPSALESMVAVGSGHPEVALIKPVLGALNSRGTSTIAAGARGFAKALEAPTAPAAAARLAQQSVGQPSPQNSIALQLANLASSDPHALASAVGDGPARALIEAARAGPDRVAVTHFVLSTRQGQAGMDYRQRIAAFGR